MLELTDKVLIAGIFFGVTVGDFVGLVPQNVNIVLSDFFLMLAFLRFLFIIKIPKYLIFFIVLFIFSQIIDLTVWFLVGDKFFLIDSTAAKEFFFENAKFFIAISYFVVAYNVLLESPSIYEKSLKLFPYFIILQAIVAIFLWGLGYYNDAFSPRFRAFVPNQNYLAISLNTAVAAILYFQRNWSGLKKSLLLTTFFFLILLTGSRGGMITFFLVVFSSIFIVRERFVKNTAALFILVILIAAVSEVTINLLLPHINKGSEILNRLYSVKYVEGALVKSHRLQAYSYSLELIKDTYFLGIGKGFYLLWTQFEHSQRLLSHNTYLQILAENGVIGLAAWLILFGLNLKKISKEKLILILPIFIASFSTSLDKFRLLWLLLPYIFMYDS